MRILFKYSYMYFNTLYAENENCHFVFSLRSHMLIAFNIIII